MARFMADLLADSAANLERPATRIDAVGQLVASRGVQALTLYRLGQRRPGGPVSVVLHRIVQLVFTLHLDPRAKIHPGVTLRHPMCVVIGAGAEVGSGCILFQGVTLAKRFSGSADRPDGVPCLARNVFVGAHAVILGPITVGDGAIVGAGAVVTRDVPAGATAVGNPAIIRRP